jgi:hypothetical protein
MVCTLLSRLLGIVKARVIGSYSAPPALPM